MKIGKLPPIEVLQEHFDYNPETGELRWKKPTSRRIKVGAIAGSTDNRGYHRVCLDGEKLLVHRIAWALHYGEDPYPHIVDHKEGVENGNAISNLRLANHSLNALNSKLRVTNTSTCRGVYYIKNRQKWGASISLSDGERVYLGTFITKEDAISARLKAEADNNIYICDR